MFKHILTGAVFAGILIAAAAAAPAAPIAAPGAPAAASAPGGAIQQVYYWRGRYYPYGWRGRYYHPYYHRYYWRGRYWYHRRLYNGRWSYW